MKTIVLLLSLALLPNIQNKSTISDNNITNIEVIDTAELKLKNYKVTSNNNPFNIRYCKSNDWVGKFKDENLEFESFRSYELGIRAGIKLIRNYDKLYSKNTIRTIIEKYAPFHENDTELYIKNLCKFTKFKANQKLDLSDTDTLLKLAEGISLLEGNHVSSNQLKQVFNKYFNS